MPLYEYECDACGKRDEILQKFSDAPKTDCSHCHEPKLRRLVSATHFQLKGTGWYETDFKNSGKTASTSQNKTTPSTSTQADTSTSSGAKKKEES